MRKKKQVKPEVDEKSAVVGQKKAVLIGLKHPEINTDIKGSIMRMKQQLIDLRGFSEDNITLLIEDEPSCFQPTKYNIEIALSALVYLAHSDDTLFVHLIAHGCKPGIIVSSDKQALSDYFFGKLLGNRNCTITFVSDCQIERAGKPMCCSLSTNSSTEPSPESSPNSSDTKTRDELVRKILKCEPRRNVDYLIPGCMCFGSHSGNLHHVEFCKDEENEDAKRNKKRKRKSKSKSKSKKKRKVSSTDPIQATLFTAFDRDPKGTEDEELDEREKRFQRHLNDLPKLFFPPPVVASTSSMEHTLYGGFTNVILDIMEETQGQVTNLELAQRATEKFKMQGIHQKPGYQCSGHHHACER